MSFGFLCIAYIHLGGRDRLLYTQTPRPCKLFDRRFYGRIPFGNKTARSYEISATLAFHCSAGAVVVVVVVVTSNVFEGVMAILITAIPVIAYHSDASMMVSTRKVRAGSDGSSEPLVQD